MSNRLIGGSKGLLKFGCPTSKVKCDGSNNYSAGFNELVSAESQPSDSEFQAWR